MLFLFVYQDKPIRKWSWGIGVPEFGEGKLIVSGASA
jgi:hypothetical protein